MQLEEVGLWTQTLLARDELDGWPGLRPYAVCLPLSQTNLLQHVMRPESVTGLYQSSPAANKTRASGL